VDEPRKLTRRQRRAFEIRDGEDAYAFIARTHRSLRYRDLPELFLLRGGDAKQMEALRLLVDLRMVVWTRALALGTVVLGVCTIVAAFIVRS
jgi:hypothetical protein